MAGKTPFIALISGIGLWLLAMAAPEAAFAQCCAPPAPPAGCNCSPPPCCSPPSPPPQQPPCCSPGHNINIPGVNVNVAASVIVNASVQANVRAGAGASSQVFVGGGGGGGGIVAGAVGAIPALNVEGMRQRTAYEATRSMYKKVVIQAFCFDDKEVPHPASQLNADRDIDDAYDGELYRCIAGAHMQITIAEWKERISFEGGQTISCQKGESLYHVAGSGSAGAAGGGHGAGATLQCRPQKPARDCNERSLLRRFGAGIKILTIMWTEHYTAYREESSSSSSASSGMSLDGGVGGIAY